MQLTKHTDYALRVLIYLALRPEATISEIADYYQISRNHLVKVVHALGCKGFVATTRGKNGGVRLARPAGAIGIGEVVRRMESNMDLVECFNARHPYCAVLPVCALKGVFHRAAEEFLSVLDRYTVADALVPGAELPIAAPRMAPMAGGHALETRG